MRQLRSLAVLVLIAWIGLAGARAAEVVEVVSPGGVRAWLLHDVSVPLLAVEFRFQGGAAVLPPEKAGAASMAAAMLSEGAGERDGEAFRQVLADNAIGLSFDAGRDEFSGNVVSLTENRELAADLLRDALLAPRLEAAALERVRDGMMRAARARAQQPNSIAYREWRERAFAGHPYAIGVEGTEESLAGLQREDLQAFLDQVLTRQSLIVGVAGDITPAELAPLLDRMFGGLPDATAPAEAPPPPAVPAGVSVRPHPSPQSVIVFGHAGIARSDPDWPAASIVTQILGGSAFTSRLGREVREKRGLAYGIGVGLSTFPDSGLVMGQTATRNEAVAEVLAIIREEWRRLAEEGPRAEEVAEAKAYLIGSFPISLDSTGAIASVLVQMQVHDLGIDYWGRRPALFEAVTAEDAGRVSRRLLDVDALLSVVTGQPEGVTSSF